MLRRWLVGSAWGIRAAVVGMFGAATIAGAADERAPTAVQAEAPMQAPVKAVPVADEDPTRQWPQWRGPWGDGRAPHADPPIEWSAEKNVAWKVELPGEGSATPVIWGDRLFLLAAVKTDRLAEAPAEPAEDAKTLPPKEIYQFLVLCLHRATGRELWRQAACEAAPHEGRHATNTYASGSPVTDGRRLYASFGSRGLFCYDLEGRLLWRREFGRLRTRFGWGEGSSPALHDGRLFLVCDQEQNSFLIALDARTGETLWRVDRDEPTSWATPLVVRHGERTQLIVNGTRRVRSYDPETGAVRWSCGGQTVNAIPSPLAADGVVYCMSGYRGAAAFAIPLDAEGDLTDTDRVLWSHRQATPYVPSPVLVDGRLFFTRENSAVLSCLDARTGAERFGPQRIPGLTNLYASPVAARDRLYFVDRDGRTTVLKQADRIEAIATNSIDEPVDASPALVGRQLFLRGVRHLYCIEQPLDQRPLPTP